MGNYVGYPILSPSSNAAVQAPWVKYEQNSKLVKSFVRCVFKDVFSLKSMGHKPLLRSAVDLQSQEATSNWPLNWNLAARLEKLGCLPQQCWNNSRLGMNESSRYPHKILSLLKLRCPMNATRKQHTPETSGATSKHSYLTQHVTILRHDDTNVLSR